ncbi:hypothetical protein ACFFWC_27800 [Plantactinospora siamensis]|uniref:Uncharacterized protein n=1 Tax=Plantactinospora siamensis TaxID=555372 RepID=A0ABV6NXW1_9ACTN
MSEHSGSADGMSQHSGGADAMSGHGGDADERVESRAEHLLPEERAAGSADPEAQAEAILADSDLREADQRAAPDTVLEHRTSAEAAGVEPPD